MKLVKGSQAARDFMKSLRDKRKQKGGKIVPPIEQPITPVVETGAGIKRPNSWITHIKSYCKAHDNMSYFKALQQPDIKQGYKK